MTDKIQPDSSKKSVSTTDDKTPALTPLAKAKKKAAASSKIVHKVPTKTSPLALIIAVVSLVSVGATTYWQMQQTQKLSETLNQNTSSAINAKTDTLTRTLKQQFSRQLVAQEQKTAQEMNRIANIIKNSNAQKVSELEREIAQLSQNKPSDWLIHEAEYLIRVAARSMWLERDTKAAIGLLKDADNRLDELNDPRFLPIRKLIHQDIEHLKLMPKLNTEPTILTLMALNEQLQHLPLNPIEVISLTTQESDFQLSKNIDDWQVNLNKTWLKFLDTFVLIHPRDGTAKPLLSPEQQSHLVENLSLKLAQAQWAVRSEKTAIYQQTLTDVENWFASYFDMNANINQNFLTDISELKKVAISYNYPSTLVSLTAMRQLISDLPSQQNEQVEKSVPAEIEKSTSKQTDEPPIEQASPEHTPPKDERPSKSVTNSEQVL